MISRKRDYYTSELHVTIADGLHIILLGINKLNEISDTEHQQDWTLFLT